MSVLESYEELLKPSENLLNRGFCFDQISAFSVYSHMPSHPKLLKYNFKNYLQPNQQTCTIASVDCKFDVKNLSTRVLLATNKLYKLRMSCLFSDSFNTRFQFDIESSLFEGLYRRNFEVLHKNENFNLKFGVNSDKCLNLAAVVGRGSYGLGVDLGFCWQNQEFCKRVMALWYLRNDQRVVVQVAKNKKNCVSWTDASIATFFWFKINEQVNLAAKWKTEIEGGDPESEIAVEWKGDDYRVLKAKLANCGKAAICMRSQVHPLISLVASGRFNIFDTSNPHLQFSFRVKFNQ